MIDSKEITVVVQGAIDKKNTSFCLSSIRKYLPNSKIILSTWKNSNVEGLDFDLLIENEDPGAPICEISKNKNNVNRQILSTKTGLFSVKTKYSLKLRTDICLTNTNFLKYFDVFDDYRNPKCKIFKNRVVLCNLYCSNPESNGFALHISDWVQFGLTEDLLNLWDIPLQNEEEAGLYFLNNPVVVEKQYSNILCRYFPEQYITISCLKKAGIDFNLEAFYDKSPANIQLTKLLFANNFIIVDYKKYGIKFLKYSPFIANSIFLNAYSFNDWLCFYKKFCNFDYKLPFLVEKLNNEQIKFKIMKFRKHLFRIKHCYRVLIFEVLKVAITEAISCISYLNQLMWLTLSVIFKGRR